MTQMGNIHTSHTSHTNHTFKSVLAAPLITSSKGHAISEPK